MQFKFDNGNSVGGTCVKLGQVLKIDNTLMAEGYEKDYDLRSKIRLFIDEMGKKSAVAQDLESPITSAKNLMKSNHILYMMTEQNTPAHFSVIGFLKIGRKKLYIYNKKSIGSETSAYCLLDFYIHESKQRKGYGKQLIDYMLQDKKLDAKNLVINNPTTQILQFMWKNFQLSKFVNQEKNFVIYEEFFDELDNNHDNTGNRTSGYNHPSTFERHDDKQHESMDEIIKNKGPSSSIQHNQNNDFVNNQLNEVKPDTAEVLDSLQINKTSGNNHTPPTFGCHEDHKHQDSMDEEIIKNTGASSSSMQHSPNKDFVCNQLNEVKPDTEEARLA